MDHESLETFQAAGSASSAPSPSLVPAMLAGLGAALVGGIAWTVLTAVTGYEIGFAAWALGGLVGFGMAHATTRRGTGPAAAAAALSIVGLLIARALIGEFVLGSSTLDEVLADEQLMVEAATLDLQFSGGFPADVQARYDALADGDTISDALWEEMVAAGSSHLETLSEEERMIMAQQLTGVAIAAIGPLGRMIAQMSVYDLLWAFLAVTTAWSMMNKEEEESRPTPVETPVGASPV